MNNGTNHNPNQNPSFLHNKYNNYFIISNNFLVYLHPLKRV